MIVCDLYILGSDIRPVEAYPILLIHSNPVLPLAVLGERVKLVSRGSPEFV
jgi:hypothetical protein